MHEQTINQILTRALGGVIVVGSALIFSFIDVKAFIIPFAASPTETVLYFFAAMLFMVGAVALIAAP